MDVISNFSKNAENAIEEETATAERLEREGRKLTRLNIGDPAVFFPTPKYLTEAYAKALAQGKTHYVNPRGILQLREAVSARYKRHYKVDISASDGIFITNGVSEAIMSLNIMLVNPGEMGILFTPYYAICKSSLGLAGGDPLLMPYNEEKGWELDTEELEAKISAGRKEGKRIKYMMVTNPSNPTGMVLDRKTLERLVEVAKNNDIIIISDEIYDEIIYAGVKFTSMCQVAKGVPHIILNGASKDLDATGFRIGFTLIPENDRASEAMRLKFEELLGMRLCANTPAQYAIADGINNVDENKKEVKELVAAIEERSRFATKLINESRYMHVVPPRGAYYIFPKLDMKMLNLKNDREFVHTLLLEEGVLLTRGSGFGCHDHVRLVALPPKEILELAIEKINAFCKRHSR
ncbi:MAG: pyridoxal phosphate-dependent aminotransferase [Candidatus Micrarchaeota archaeon]|nr:pyridoxal phosphate-dependent aminotransferase [Candidatus Micrarchaeota archaeon]